MSFFKLKLYTDEVQADNFTYERSKEKSTGKKQNNHLCSGFK